MNLHDTIKIGKGDEMKKFGTFSLSLSAPARWRFSQ
jgi:hypothetical protein